MPVKGESDLPAATKAPKAAPPSDDDDLFGEDGSDQQEPTIATHPDLPGITASFEMFTPEQAMLALSKNSTNRSLKERRASGVARDILDDRWMFNGQTIVLDTDGNLLDGQHRCDGIVEADRAVWCIVVRGVPREAQATMDSGAARSVADQLHLAGMPNASLVASITRQVITWNRGEQGVAGSGNIAPTFGEVILMAKADKRIVDAARWVSSARAKAPEMKILRQAVAGFGYWLLTSGNHETGHYFMESVYTGAELKEGSPILAFRRRITAAGQPGAEKLGAKDQIGLLITAWNAFQAGQNIKKLQRPVGGSFTGQLPSPVYVAEGLASPGTLSVEATS